jgi:hypothetical protein
MNMPQEAGVPGNRTQPDTNPETLWNPHASRPEVRGHKTYHRPASAPILAAAWFADACFVVLLFSMILLFTPILPIPRLWWLPAFAGLALIYVFGLRAAYGRTPGEFFWQLSRSSSNNGMGAAKLHQYDQISVEVLVIGATMNLLAAILSGWACYETIFSLPLWKFSESIELDSYFPVATQDTDWTVMPFFYGLGAWPTRYQGRPVLYALPYEKGPPRRFAGHIQALWEAAPETGTSVIFEGPRTPNQNYSRSRIERCLSAGGMFQHPITCIKVRHATLVRHLEEIRQSHPLRGSLHWKLKWFLVKNPALPPEEQARGIFLSASNGKTIQNRYILITPQGTHQTFILNTSDPGAAELFDKSIRSLRVSDDLGQGIAWIDRRLESTRMNDFESLKDPEKQLEFITQIQGVLLSKISVDPKTFETYFHLAGTSLKLAQLASQTLTHVPAENENWAPTQALMRGTLFSAKNLIESASRYGEDVSPLEPRLPKLRAFADQARKIKSGF